MKKIIHITINPIISTVLIIEFFTSKLSLLTGFIGILIPFILFITNFKKLSNNLDAKERHDIINLISINGVSVAIFTILFGLNLIIHYFKLCVIIALLTSIIQIIAILINKNKKNNSTK